MFAKANDVLLPAAEPETLEEIVISAPEPRFVAPSRRDRIGRIWAPVYINDKGPFRMVLDTGATHSGIIDDVARALALSPQTKSSNAILRGVTGSAVVPMVRVDSLVVGDLVLEGKRLPIITDALGGAQGILGSEGLADKRIFIDFRNDFILIKRSQKERAAPGFITIPVKLERGKLLTVDAHIGSVRVKAIIDTGGQVSVANTATRNAIFSNPARRNFTLDNIVGVTTDMQQGEGYSIPPISIGPLTIRSSHMTFVDLHIFEYWKLTQEPAILIGMDALGLLDTLIIDYKRSELQIKMREDEAQEQT
jgi:predicted aspartyl protease